MDRRQMLRLLAYTGVHLGNLGTAATFFSGCAGRRGRTVTPANGLYAVTLLVDGWSAARFRRLLQAGELPNIQRHLVDRGVMVETCVTTFPSTTGPAHLPFVTGLMPGQNNCPGLRWVDRNRREVRDYCNLENVLFNADFPASNRTIYEMLEGARTTCIFDFASRGATEAIPVPAKTLWYIALKNQDEETWEKMDRAAVEAFQYTYLGGGELPRYCFVWMPGVDHLAHFHGPDHDIVLDRTRDVDRHVGRIAETLQKAGIYDRTLLALVSDHGMRDNERHLDIRHVLQRYGLSVLKDLSNNDSFNSLYQNNAARGVSGNGFALLYFADRQEGRLGTMTYAWNRHLDYGPLRSFRVGGDSRVDLLDELRKEPGIQLVAARESEDVFRILGKGGEAKVERHWSTFRYTVTDTDPLGYTAVDACKALQDGAYHDKDAWFAASCSSGYPDALFQITQLFDAERCGDVVISSTPGWDLMDQGHIGTHGGLERDEMTVPCVLAGPGIRQGTIPYARTIDLQPTTLQFLAGANAGREALNVFL